MLVLEEQYQGFRLHGWMSGPGQYRSMNDVQYVFVNNRMMRDKLIFHAIRQAYEGLLPEDKFPYFVLYLDVPCNEVDVNVHPAKHEVRFHQSRLVHDFIFSVLNDAIGAAIQPAVAEKTQTTDSDEHSRPGYGKTAEQLILMSRLFLVHYSVQQSILARMYKMSGRSLM